MRFEGVGFQTDRRRHHTHAPTSSTSAPAAPAAPAMSPVLDPPSAAGSGVSPGGIMLALLPPEGDAAATVGADTCAAGGGGLSARPAPRYASPVLSCSPIRPLRPLRPAAGHNRVEYGSERTSPTEIPEDASARLRFSYVAAKATDVALALGTCSSQRLWQSAARIRLRSM